MKVSLFFGSSNPVHNGHLNIANFMYNHYPIDEIWFVLSPLNPLKNAKDLLPEHQRLQLLKAGIQPYSYFKASTLEFELPKPSYTYYSIREFVKRYPDFCFSIIMGNDAMFCIEKWKNHQVIITNYTIYLYPRQNIILPPLAENIIQTEAPLQNISSTEIRQKIKNNESVKDLLPPAVFEILEKEKYYSL